MKSPVMREHAAGGADCPSDYALDRLRFGELAGERETVARGHLAGCARCSARLAAMEAVVPSPLVFPAEAAALAVARERATAERAPWTRRLRGIFWGGGGLVLAAAAAIVLRVTPDDGIRSKGRVDLAVAVSRAGEAVKWADPGERLRPRDRLRFQVSS